MSLSLAEEESYGAEISKAYNNGELVGWGEVTQPGLAKESFNLLKDSFQENLVISGQSRELPKRMMLYEIVRKVLGKDTENIAQRIGDCVSWAARNSTEYLTCSQILLNAALSDEDTALFLAKARIQFRTVFAPYYYGSSRVYVGQGRLGNGDGSMGSWMAKAVMEYGTLFSDVDGVPKYSGPVAKQWGSPNASSVLDQWKPKADEYDVKTTAPVRNWDDFKNAIGNGYTVHMCSNKGYRMEASSDGFHQQSGSWAHAMCGIGYDEEYSEPYGLILNSWGNCFSDDTEVLTKDGWKLFKDVNNEEVATLNPENWQLEYQTPTEKHKYPFQGELISVNGRDTDLLVTPNHRMYNCDYHKDKSKSENWVFTNASNLNKHFFVKKDANWVGVEHEIINIADKKVNADDWFEFMGYFLSEGYASTHLRTNYSEAKRNIGLKVATKKKQSVTTVGISQKTDDVHIHQCLNRLPFHFGKHIGNAWTCRNQRLGKYLTKYSKAKDKFVPDYIKSASTRLIKIFIEAAMRGDGTEVNGKYVYYTSSKQFANDMQELCLKCGYAADISSIDRRGRDNGTGGITRSIEYRVNIKRKELMQHITHTNTKVPYNGSVYCLTVPNSTLYVRRNGKASWCGNCHGRLKDFKTGEDLPAGVLRVKRADIERHIRGGESFAYSNFVGFPEQFLDKELFNLLK